MISREAMTPNERSMLRVSDWEIAHMIRVLEVNGYVVRKPSEADLPIVLEVEPHQTGPYEIAIRADTRINGVPYAFVQRYPVELVLSPDDADFREDVLPRLMGDELGRYIGDKLAQGLAAQVEAKITPLVPEKRMSLDEIVSHLAYALGTSKHRIDPRHYDENDNRRPVS